MTTFILVPGACHGGWWYREAAAILRTRGHAAVPITLTGVGDRAHLLSAAINLDTHVDDVTSLIRAERLDDIVLVGHSYGGSVITAVADRDPGIVRALLYLDAFVPADGDSCWSMTDDEQRAWYANGSARTGIAVDPLPFFDERATPHPLGSLMQATRLTGAWTSVTRKHYVAAAGWPGVSPFAPTTERVRKEPGWVVTEAGTPHSFAALTEPEFAALMTEAAGV